MIKLENYEVVGWEHAIRGMRNPMNSWEKSDSKLITSTLKEEEVCPGITSLVSVRCDPYISVGPNDFALMKKLRNAGTDHRKFMRMLVVYVDITAPLYWWKEFDTYKVGTVANSCSTMHKIHAKEFTLEDFSCELIYSATALPELWDNYSPYGSLIECVSVLNQCRNRFLETGDKRYWDQMIQLLPSSYNQKRTIMFNYEVLANMYKSRKNHKLAEWRDLCKWIEGLPYAELIVGDKEENEHDISRET